MWVCCTAAGTAHFAHGMCKACYEEYLEVTGGTSNGADPPAFTAGIQAEVCWALSPCTSRQVHILGLSEYGSDAATCHILLQWRSLDSSLFQFRLWLQLKAKGVAEDALQLPGLEQEDDEEEDIEQQLEAVLQQDGMGKYTRVSPSPCICAAIFSRLLCLVWTGMSCRS